MKEELEICVRSLVPFKQLYDDMINKGFHVQEDFILNDIYMVHNDIEVSLENEDVIFSNYVLIRETVGKKKMLVLKHKEMNKKGEIIKQESVKCPIDDCTKAYEFMKAIGYKKIFDISDHNILMSNGKNEIYLQDVKGIGTYVEMEQKNLLLKNNNGDTIDKMKNNLQGYALQIDTKDYFARKAYDAFKKIFNE